MKINIRKILNYILLPGIVIYLFQLFYPRTYEVPHLIPKAHTLFWNLSTGSHIAYTLIPAKGGKKPFPVLFLQGGPGGFISDRNIEMLKPLSENGYDIYLYDQIGSGQSSRLKNIEEYTALRHKEDLEEIVKKIGSGKVILIGQSWGAELATLFIADNPEKVEKAIFTSPGPIQPIIRELSAIKAPDSLKLKNPVYTNSQANKEVQNMRIRFITKWAYLFHNKLATDNEVDDFQTKLNNWLNKSTLCDTSKALKAEGGGGFYAQIMTIKSFANTPDPRPKLKGTKIPLLVMKGQCDNQKWGFTNEYLQLFSNHKLVIIPDAGHSISIEQPELYLKTIQDFLNN